MLLLMAVLLAGVLAGRVLAGRIFARRGLCAMPRLIGAIIWLLLFLLGAEIGSDPLVVRGMASLGRTALLLFALSTAGSIAAAWLLGRTIRRKQSPANPPADER